MRPPEKITARTVVKFNIICIYVFIYIIYIMNINKMMFKNV
ncbi:unnamed protein product, partial [Callosobruchus maculatus]